MKPMASGKRNSSSSASSNKAARFVVCVSNEEYPASLEVRKLYRVLQDAVAERHRMIRVIDESGEDYLYPADRFLAVRLPHRVQQAIAAAS